MRKILFILIWISFPLIISGQSPEDLYLFAQSQYNNKNYEIALKEYQRYLYFSHKPEPEVLKAIADCYSKLENYEKAADYYEKAFFSTSSVSFRLDVLFKKSECKINLKEFGIALIDLLSYSDSIDNESLYKLNFYCGICYFGMDNFLTAEEYFLKALGPDHETEAGQIQQIFENRKSFYSPNPLTAYVMSGFLPGLGQFYSGDIKNGINSMLLTTFLAGVGIRIAVYQTVMDAVFTVLPWFQRYYMGGMVRAEGIAIDKRSRRRSSAFNEIIEVIASAKE